MIQKMHTDSSGIVSWESPSNIALVKYWGKYGIQLPMNPSLSFTLKNSVVRLKVNFHPRNQTGTILQGFTLNGLENEKFKVRLESFLQGIKAQYRFIDSYEFVIESESTFPHSAGIASSAAAFSALALVLETIHQKLGKVNHTKEAFLRRASNTARLGSGSACRSVYGGFSIWGKTTEISGSDNKFAIPVNPADIHPVFNDIHDAILILDDTEKEVSSSQGHSLMQNHPFRKSRKTQAKQNIQTLLAAMKSGDEKLFVEVIENEALTLHGLMMTSNPGFILMKKETLQVIELIRKFRNQTGINMGFTLDAGPNIHLIYFEKDREPVLGFIEQKLVTFCRRGSWIDDKVGNGPVQTS